MTIDEFVKALTQQQPPWTAKTTTHGNDNWIDIVTDSARIFTVQITPMQGIGVSERREGGLDFSGHDEAFDNLESVLSYIKEQLLMSP